MLNNAEHKILINGISTDYLNVHDRSIQYGDGLFETVLCSQNKLYYWLQHYQRLQNSAHRLAIKCPAEKMLLDDINQLLKNQNTASDVPETDDVFVIKIILSRGVGERGYRYSNNITANRVVMLSQVESNYSSLLNGQLLRGELFLCKTQVSINESLSGIKHLNRLDNVLASNEWNDTSKKTYVDGLMLNAEDHVIECTMSNIFAVRDGRLYTPDLKLSGVRGVMRDQVIKIAAEVNIDVSICDITLDKLLTMDELFITNSLIGLKSISNLVDTDYKESQVTKLIFDALLSTKENHVQAV